VKVYTGQTTGEKLKKIIELDMGVMISSNPNTTPSKDLSRVYCALDNGAFSCFRKGYPFQADVFRQTIKACYKHNITLDFIVCPDIVCGGLDSLSFSMKWAAGELLGSPNLALVMQDGMKPQDISVGYHLKHFSYIFIGGSVGWKWKTAEEWVRFAKDNNKKVHIGQCGRLQYLERARDLGVDSVDSTSFTVNNSFHIVEELNGKQLRLLA